MSGSRPMKWEAAEQEVDSVVDREEKLRLEW